MHPEYRRQRRPFAHDPMSNPPLSCSLDLAKPQGPVPCKTFYTAHQPSLSICSAVRNGIVTYAGVHGTYAIPLRMLVRSYAWMYLVLCAGAAVPGQNVLCCVSQFAAVCCTSAVTSGGLAIMMCRALIVAAVCCACPAMTGGLAIMNLTRNGLQ